MEVGQGPNWGCSAKGKFVPMLNELSTTPWRCMGNGCIHPHFLALVVSWRSVASFTPRPLHPREKSPRYLLVRRLGGLQSRPGRRGEQKILDNTGTQISTQHVGSLYTDWAIRAPESDVPPFIPSEIHWNFWGMYFLHLQGQKCNPSKKSTRSGRKACTHFGGIVMKPSLGTTKSR
jgi:hypothetical protein